MDEDTTVGIDNSSGDLGAANINRANHDFLQGR
jgi:hypothetical protein